MAYENLKKYKCGNCGNDNYHLFVSDEKNIEQIITECTKCKCKSEINQKIIIEFGETDNDGIMCVY